MGIVIFKSRTQKLKAKLKEFKEVNKNIDKDRKVLKDMFFNVPHEVFDSKAKSIIENLEYRDKLRSECWHLICSLKKSNQHTIELETKINMYDELIKHI